MSDDRPFSLAVVMANRDDARFLQKSLSSVIQQEPPPDELIVVDDQSTDASVAVIREALDGCSYARLVENPVNLGPNRAFNVGINLAKSKYVFCLSANDFVLPGVFARARSCLERYPNAGLWSAMMWVADECGKPLTVYPSAVLSLRDRYFSPDACRKLAFRLGNWFAGTMIYRRQLLAEIGGFQHSLRACSDLFACLVLASRAGAVFSPVPLANLRRHGESFSARTLRDDEALNDTLASLRKLGKALEPRLFTAAMLDRTEARIRFASVRASGHANFGVEVTNRRLYARALTALACLIPTQWRRTRVGLMFLAMRPFDVLPMMWYRLLGWSVVRLRERLRPGCS